jgi:rubrerythrin
VVARRGLLAGAASLALAGCARTTATEDEAGGAPPERSATSRQGDIELLRGALALVAGVATAYEQLAKSAPARQRETFRRFAGHGDEHITRISRAVQDLGGDPEVGWVEYPADGENAVDGAIGLEARAIAFYLDMLPKLHDADLRTMIASILTVNAGQLAFLRGLAGEPPAPEAFVYGAVR